MRINIKVNLFGALLLSGFLFLLGFSVLSMNSIFSSLEDINTTYACIDNLKSCDNILLLQLVEGQRIALSGTGSVDGDLLTSFRLKKSSLNNTIRQIQEADIPVFINKNEELIEDFSDLYDFIDEELIKKIFNNIEFAPAEISYQIMTEHRSLQKKLTNYENEIKTILDDIIIKNRNLLKSFFFIFSLTLVVLSSLFLFSIFFLKRRIIGTVTKTSVEISRLSGGSARLDYRFKLSGDDEISELCTSFNSFLEKMEDMISQIIDAGKMSSDFGIKIEEQLIENTGISGELYNSVSLLREYFFELKDTIENIKEKSSAVLSNSNDSKTMIEQQTTKLSSSEQSVRNIVNEISLLRKSGNTSLENTLQLKHDAETGLLIFKQLDSKIESFLKTATDLKKINNVFDDISNKIKVLGINAAIEAARAGNAGSGFKVVSSEIVELGELVSSNAALTQNNLKEVMDEIQELKSKSDNGKSQFQIIETGSGIVYSSITEMTSKLKKHEEHEAVMIDNIFNLKKGLDAVTEMSIKLGSEISKITESITELDKVFSSSDTSLDKVENKADQLTNLTSRLEKTVNENHQVSEKLNYYLKHFNSW